MGDIRVGGSASPTTGTDTQTPDTVTVQSGDTLEQIAKDQNVDVSDLLAANPQIGDPDHLNAGMEIHIPPRPTTAGTSKSAKTESSSSTGKSDGSKRAEANLDRAMMRGVLTPGRGSSNDPVANGAKGTDDSAPPLSTDPRFSKFNEALEAGDGPGAVAEAKKLIAELQTEKPPNQQLLNEARMGLAAGAMVAGDLNQAQSALLSIHAKSLTGDDKKTLDELRDVLIDARRGEFSKNFAQATSPDGNMKTQGKAAADQAHALVELLQKTDPHNTTAIDQARMKLANAQLLTGDHRGAEKSLHGINEKQLAPEQKEYLKAIQQELHAQQIVALGTAYGSDIKKGHYKEAVSNAKAVVNDLAKYFPDAKDKIMASRLDLATAQLLSGDVKGARQSLSHVSQKEFQAAPKDVQGRYGEINKYVDKAEKERAEQADIKHRLGEIDNLVRYGDQDLKYSAVKKAEDLLADIQRKHPGNDDMINGMKLTVAGTKLAAGDTKGALAMTEDVAKTSDEPGLQEQAKLMHAQTLLAEKPPQLDNAMKEFRQLAQDAETPEVRNSAKEMVRSIEGDYLSAMGKKADQEAEALKALKKENFDDQDMDDAPKIQEPHKQAMHDLGEISHGAQLATSIMQGQGLTFNDLRKLSPQDIAKLPGVKNQDDVQAMIRVLHKMPEADLIAKGDFQGKHFSWDTGKPYVDPSYLDTAFQAASKWVGEQVRSAPGLYEGLKHSDSILARGLGYVGGAIMDGFSAAGRAGSWVHDQINVASDFYHKEGGVLGKLGVAATFVADMGASVVTMPVTVFDPKATDEERESAIKGSLIMFGTAGLLKVGGPAFSEALGAAGRGVAESRLGQFVGKSWVGDAARWTASKAAGLEEKFEATTFAKTADKVKAVAGKVNPFGGSKEVKGTGGDSGKPPVGGSGDGAKIPKGGDGTGAGESGKIPKGGKDPDAADTLKMRKVGEDPDAADTVKMKKQGGDPDAEDTARIRKGGAGDPDPADTVKMKKTGGDATKVDRKPGETEFPDNEDTIPDFKIPPSKGMDDAVDELVGGKTAGDVQGSITRREMEGVENSLVNAKRKELAGPIEEQVSRDLKARGFSGDELATKTKQQVDALVNENFPESRLRKMVNAEYSPQDIQRMALKERIYNNVYHGEFPEKVSNVNDAMQAGYERKLEAAKGPQLADKNGNLEKDAWETSDGKGVVQEDGYWQHRAGGVGLDREAVRTGEGIRRFYFNLKPENAGEFADYLTSKLNAKGVGWQYKMPRELANFDRPDAGVLYVEKANYQSVKKIVMDYAKEHPEAFADGTPAFTKAVGNGIGVAEEPLQAGLPKNPNGKYSYGELRSEIIADETLKAKPGATSAEIQAAVRKRMESMGLDADKPWLQRRGPDDL